MRSVLLAGLIALALGGCVSANVTRYRTLEPKASAEEVAVYTARLPDREFEEVGLIEVEGAKVSSYPELVKRAQKEGAKIGADAIIVSRRPISGAAAVVSEVGDATMASVREEEIPRLWVVAIIWKDNGGQL